MVGRRLLYSSSALASLGDAMFGYSQGIIASNQVQPSFIRRMYGKDVTLQQIRDGQDGVDVFLQGQSQGSYFQCKTFLTYFVSYRCLLPQPYRTGCVVFFGLYL